MSTIKCLNKYLKATDMKAILFLTFSFIFLLQMKAQEVYSIDKILSIAKENNLSIKAKSMDIQATQSLVKSARELPKLSVGFEYGNTNGFDLDDGLSVSQTIPFPTVFGAKKSLINEQVEGKKIEKQLSENELIKEVRKAFYYLQYLKFNSTHLMKLDSIYLDFIRVGKERYQAGDISRLDSKNTSIKQGEVVLMMKENDMLIQKTYKSLKNLMQIEEDFEIEMPKEFIPLVMDELADDFQLSSHPQIQLIEQEIKILDKSQKVDKAENLPDFTLGYNSISQVGIYERNGVEKWYDKSQRFRFFDIGIDIPITYGATKSKIRSVEYQKQSLAYTSQWQEKQMKSDLRSEINQYTFYYEQHLYLKEKVLPFSKELMQSAMLEYKTGEISYVEYLLAIETAYSSYRNYLDNIQQINESVININSFLNQ
ncbi:MAG: TolC family protein [Chitinophagales bacterium]|nr:TolC family protein [Chitinophagales bacterium]